MPTHQNWLIAPVITLSLLAAGCANTSTLSSSNRQHEDGAFTGHYVYYADAATFTLCETGQRLPVADTPSALIMERAYLASRLDPLTPLSMSLTGKIERQVGMEESQGKIPHLVVEAVMEVGKPISCAAQTPLTGTAWEWLPDENVQSEITANNLRLPHITLNADGRASGYTGCNNLNGQFDQNGENLRFKGIATTRMACTSSTQNQLESQLTNALNKSARHEISNGILTLKDSRHNVLGRFKANHAH